MKKNASMIGFSMIFSILVLLHASVVYAAPVYIDSFADFPAYPYNTNAYMQSGAYVGCGPATGAMILGYFEHYFGLTGLLTNPVAGVDEGLDTAWALHGASYMNTGSDGFGSVYNIKPGLEDYADDRGFEIKVMAHAATDAPIADPTYWYNDYGPYGVAWTNDGIFWLHPGDVWDIDPDLFCDFVGAKLSAGIAVFLTVDSDSTEGGDHWIPCVGYDKDAGTYYYYNTYDTSLHNAPIAYYERTTAAGDYAISFVRTVEYIGQTQPPEEEHDVEAVSQTVSDNEVMPGDVVDIDVTVRNNGDFTETFDVTCYYDSVELGTIMVVDLAPGESRVLTFTWDTTGVLMNGYAITAWADSGEAIVEVDEDNNWCTMPTSIFVIPEVPIGTILASLSMFVALIGFVGFKRFRPTVRPH